METIQRNTHFDLAASFVLHTNQNVYLTGRAGTGKTTFLKYVREHTNKKIAVAAPTGVAAINAGGVTMHSLFQLPFGSFIPERQTAFSQGPSSGTDLNTFLRNQRISKEKRKMWQELELLIIDEISMVRADMLDAADQILKHFRKSNAPFGGIQVLLIGDLHQLPPVVKDEEWDMLSAYYKSMFFFDALVFKETAPIAIELQTIYRQSDEKFIHLLNAIRNNTATEDDMELLNKHYDPSFYPEEGDGYIILTSHNFKADKINEGNLGRLQSELKIFEGELNGDFNDAALPVPRSLALKQGAQVMFTKNDKGENRRYYNGKIGIISAIRNDEIWIRFPGESGEIKAEMETWRNIRYQYNETADSVSEDTLGSYRQYPLRLAWAVTIHKSQGLTFERAIIDAGQSFAPGQVYVALSRLTSLNGLVLSSPISPAAIFTESRISDYNQSRPDDEVLANILQEAQEQYLQTTLTKSFGFAKLAEIFATHHASYNEIKIPHQKEALDWSRTMLAALEMLQDVGRKFEGQLMKLLPGAPVVGYSIIAERIAAAKDYFKKEMDATLSQPLEVHYKSSEVKTGTKKYCRSLQSLKAAIIHKQDEISSMAAITASLAKGEGISAAMQQSLLVPKTIVPQMTAGPEVAKQPKEDTKSISLRLLKEGKVVEEIARERAMVVSTIEGHLTHYLATGETKLSDIVTPAQEAIIRKYVKENGEKPHGEIRTALGDDVSYGAIKAVLTQLEIEKTWS